MNTSRIAAASLGTVALFAVSAILGPAAIAATAIDQNTIPSGAITSQGWVNSASVYGQVFTPSVSGTLDRIDLPLSKSVTATNATVVIQGVTAGHLPDGITIASSTVDVSSVALNPGRSTVTVSFNAPASLIAGTEYAFLVQSTDTLNAIIVAAGDAYAGGQMVWNGFGFASALAFATYMTTADAGATPPPVMQQFGMPTTGTCDAAAPLVLNWGGAGSGGWGNSWAEWMNGGRGGAVCTRTLVYSNASGHWIVG
jgi:hypothetical protein